MLVLASASPRRRQLLKLMGLSFRVRPVSIPERRMRGETADGMALRLGREKAHAAALHLHPKGRRATWILGADTVVAVDGQVLGKPSNEAQARRMLSLLSGRTHRVVTGVAVWRGSDGRICSGRSVTRVTFRELTGPEIRAYVETGEPLDVAGAYAIQGRGGVFIPRITGSWSNVVGLPLDLVDRLLREAGYSRRA